MRVESILQTVGDTPCVRIQRLAPKHVKLYVKVESFNPSGSMKDRIALGMIEYAEEAGLLKPGQTVVEATSGNMGIALAMVCAQKGYPFVAVMAENFSIERRKLIRYFGASVVLTPADQLGSGAVAKAKELASTHNWYLAGQFENEVNAKIHSQTTAREILKDFRDTTLDYWITGYGSGGTLKGVAQILRSRSPNTKVVVCEPNNSQLLASTQKQLRMQDGSPAGSHPEYRPHIMQGWSPDFIARMTEDAVNDHLIDQVLPVDGKKSLEAARALAEQEGILTGISGGATFEAALKIAARASEGSTILCMLPDTGERYLSTALFQHIGDDMNEGEQSIADSTPTARFKSKRPPLPTIEVNEEQEPLITEITTQLIDQFTSNPKQPVVLFALEWCEFCWSVRKLFKKMSIPYHAIDLDSTHYQACHLGKKLKATLVNKTGVNTLPQIFVSGEYIGGCTELFDAFNNRSIFKKLDNAGVTYNRVLDIDPYTLLPGWLHSRDEDEMLFSRSLDLSPIDDTKELDGVV